MEGEEEEEDNVSVQSFSSGGSSEFEASAAHQQKRDRVVQACSMLKVWAKGSSVCVHVRSTPQTY